MKRRSQEKSKKSSGSYSRKVKSGTHPLIRHIDYEVKQNDLHTMRLELPANLRRQAS